MYETLIHLIYLPYSEAVENGEDVDGCSFHSLNETIVYNKKNYLIRKLWRKSKTPMATAATQYMRTLYKKYSYPTRKLLRMAKTPMTAAPTQHMRTFYTIYT